MLCASMVSTHWVVDHCVMFVGRESVATCAMLPELPSPPGFPFVIFLGGEEVGESNSILAHFQLHCAHFQLHWVG